MTQQIALAGNPNSGKTTTFNMLTGANQYVGNWPGVTVERKEGVAKKDKTLIIQDLPGIYSLSPYTPEEIVARDYLLEDQPSVILNILDVTNLERNLYLTTQLIETGLPVVCALNMMDLLEKNGQTLNSEKLSYGLGVPVVEISALKNRGLDHALKQSKQRANAIETEVIYPSYDNRLEAALAEIVDILGNIVRTIENERDRRMTIMVTTFMPCSAKLPIIALIAGAFFPNQSWVSPSAYFLGVASIVLSGIALKKTKHFSGDPAPFIMELPAYHLPQLRSVVRHAYERCRSFVKKAGSIIFVSSILIWFMSHYSVTFQPVPESQSILAFLGKGLAVLFIPLGWGNWQGAVATITGLIAKENIIGTLGILFGNVKDVSENGVEVWGALQHTFTPVAAYSFLTFNLLCAPCFAAIGAIRREMGDLKWTLGAIGYQCGLAYMVSFVIYQLGHVLVEKGTLTLGTFLAMGVVLAGFYFLIRKPKPGKESVQAITSLERG